MHLLIAALLLAPQTVFGTVTEAGTGEPVAYAAVTVEGAGPGVVANPRGYYALPGMAPGRHTIEVTRAGYSPARVQVEVSGDGPVRADVVLEPRPVELGSLRAAVARESAGQSPGTTVLRIEPSLIEKLPQVGEPDVLGAVQTLPSVRAGSDFSGAPYVRGGSPDQTLVTLDGTPLFNPWHLGGLVSSIDPSAVAGVEVIPGALPARIGDRLGGAVQLRTRDGGRDQVRGRGGVGLISARALLDGPLPGDAGTFLVSGRCTYIDAVTAGLEQSGLLEGRVPYAFADALAKLTLDVPTVGAVSVTGYLNREGLSEELPEGRSQQTRWTNGMGSIRLRQPLTPDLWGEVRAGASRFSGRFHHRAGGTGEADPVAALESSSDAELFTGTAELTWRSVMHTVRGGVQVDRFTFAHHLAGTSASLAALFPAFDSAADVTTVAGFVEDDWRISDRVAARLGLRALTVHDAWYVLPRLGLRLAFSGGLAIDLGAGTYAQPVQSLRNEEALVASTVAFDFLAPADSAHGAATGRDAVLGVEWSRGPVAITVQGYVRRGDLPLPPLPSEPFDAPLLAVAGLEDGREEAEGVDVLLSWGGERASVQLAYGFLRARRSSGGASWVPRYHRAHLLDLVAAAPLGARSQLGARLQLGTGQPYTPVVGVMHDVRWAPGDDALVPHDRTTYLLGPHNSFRMPGYARLDLGLRGNYDVHWFGRAIQLAPYLQLVNVLGTENPLIPRPDVIGRGHALRYETQLPFVPSLGVEWRF